MEMDIMMDSGKIYTSAVIGMGPAGLNAALYLKRKGIDVAVMGRQKGGQVSDTGSVENYLGFEDITGQGLADEFYKHVFSLGIPKTEYYGVTSIEKKDGIFHISCEDEKVYKAKSIVYAAGSSSRKLGVPGEDTFYGRGVTYCATCDGPLYRNKEVTVVGGGNSAVEAAIDLSRICPKVTLIHRSTFRADRIIMDALYNTPNVEILLGWQIAEIHGTMGVDSITAVNCTTGEEKKIEVSGVFVEIGHIPNTSPIKGLVEFSPSGEVITDDNLMTSCDGLFAAGDVTEEPYKQITIAAGMGAKAALCLNDWITKNEIQENKLQE